MNNTALADYIREQMQIKNLSTYEVARRSGGQINPNTITRILNGEIRETRLSTLEAIATGLDVPAIEIFRVAANKPEPRNKRELLIEAFGGEELDARYIEAIESVIEGLIVQFRKSSNAENSAIQKAHAMLDEKEMQGGIVTQLDRMQADQSPEQIIQGPRVGKKIKDLSRGRDAEYYNDKPYKKPGS